MSGPFDRANLAVSVFASHNKNAREHEGTEMQDTDP